MNEKNEKLIPFGKYANQPVEVLQNDPQYTQWLTSQPWFQDRYPAIFNVVINKFGEDEETPEHNRLQAKFLDEEFRMKMCGVFIKKRKPEISHEVARGRWDLISKCHSEFNDLTMEIKDLKQKIKTLENDLDKADEQGFQPKPKPIHPGIKTSMLQQMEHSLWYKDYEKKKTIEQVRLKQLELEERIESSKNEMPSSLLWGVYNFDRISKSKSFIEIENPKFEVDAVDCQFAFESIFGSKTLKIEIKPEITDSYPAVLRQMRNNGSNILIFENFNSRGVDEKTMISFFETQKIDVFRFSDVENFDFSIFQIK